MPVAFVKASDTEFEVDAIVSDNIAVGNVFVDYKITKSGVTGSLLTLPMNLVAGTDSTYSQTIPYGGLGLSNGDKIEYRIRAIDQAIAPNTKSIPTGSPGFYNVNVVSLAPTQDSYSNNFDNTETASQDFSVARNFLFALKPVLPMALFIPIILTPKARIFQTIGLNGCINFAYLFELKNLKPL